MAKQTQTPKPLADLAYDVKALAPIGDTYGSFEKAMDTLTKATSQGAVACVLAMIAIGKTLLQDLSNSIDCMSAEYNSEHAKWFTEYNRSRGYSVEPGAVDNIKSRIRSVTVAFHLVPGVLNTLQTLTPVGQGMSNYYYLCGIMASKKARKSRRYDSLRPLWEQMLTVPLGMETASYQKTIDSLYGKVKEKRKSGKKKKPEAQTPNYGDETSSVKVSTPDVPMVAASAIPANPENGVSPEKLAGLRSSLLELSYQDRTKLVGMVFSDAELAKLTSAILDRLAPKDLEPLKIKILGLTAENPVVSPTTGKVISGSSSVPAVH